MIRSMALAASSVLLPLSLLFAVDAAQAQQDRPFMLGGQQAPMPSGPAFRDPKTGQVWTPDNVSQDGKPVAPEDRAFDPSGQVVHAGPVSEQHAEIERLGTVPITAGAAVPLVEIDSPRLRVMDAKRWRVAMFLQNNSANVYSPVLACRFFNGEKTVMDTRVLVPSTQGGERLGLSFHGPAADIYVDRVSCRIITP